MDRVTLEVIRGILHSAAGEIGRVLAGMAHSPGIRHSRDFSAAIYTVDGRMASLAGGPPLYPGVLPAPVNTVLKALEDDPPGPGDCIITNDPFITGSPPQYICAISPVTHGGRALALAVSTARHGDMGGSGPGEKSLSGDIFREGFRIPPIKIMKKGRLNAALASLLASNTRSRTFPEDLQAQIAAGRAADRILGDMAARRGLDQIRRMIPEMLLDSEEKMRSSLRRLPPGDYYFEEFLRECCPGDALPRIAGTVKCLGDSLEVDFAGTSPQSTRALNITPAAAQACVYFAVTAAVNPSAPFDDGVARAIKISAPGGTLVSAEFPAPVGAGSAGTAHLLTRAVLARLQEIVPGRAREAGQAPPAIVYLGGYNTVPGYFSLASALPGGRGASAPGDGADAPRFPLSGEQEMPAEVIERNSPLMVNSCRIIPGSCGAGKFRGSPGIQRILSVLEDGPQASLDAGGTGAASPGADGGQPGRPARVSVRIPGSEGRSQSHLPSGNFYGALKKGSLVVLESAGGGGWGSPLERDPEAVRVDVREGFVSLEEAGEIYGVVLVGTDLAVDPGATSKKRKSLAKPRPEDENKKT